MVSRGERGRSLASLRRDLEEIDRAIVIMVAARVEAACAAIEFRTQHGATVIDPAQEARVIARAKKWATQVGVSPALVEAIFRAVVDAGKERYAATNRPPVRGSRPRGTVPTRRRTAPQRRRAPESRADSSTAASRPSSSRRG